MLTAEQVKELEAAHGNVCRIVDRYDRFEFFVKDPDSATYKRWRQAVGVEAMKHAATENLIRACCVHTSHGDADGLLAKYPGAFDSDGAQNWAKKVLGLESEERGKG